MAKFKLTEISEKYLTVSSTKEPCVICGDMTGFIPYHDHRFTGARLCSDECLNEFTNKNIKSKYKESSWYRAYEMFMYPSGFKNNMVEILGGLAKVWDDMPLEYRNKIAEKAVGDGFN